MDYEAYLARSGTLTAGFRGTSMRPLLRQERDLFTVAAKGPERCRVGDVALYRRDGRYVLHRVIEVRPSDYVILGDNCVEREYGVTDGDILGVMTGFVRGGRAHSVDEPGYRLYRALWLRTIGPRVLLRRGELALGRLIKRLLYGREKT